jgi:hypothetical protein
MKRALSLCAVWIAFGIVISHANAASDRLNDLQLVIPKVAPSGQITVRMVNASRKNSLRVWTEANSWGALKWKIVIVRGAQTLVVFEDPDGVGFTKNTPQFETISPEGHVERQLDVNGEYWSKRQGGVHFEPGDRITVIYDVPPEKEAKEMHVWYGVAASTMVVK